jgi:hypothetical protein
LPDQLRSDERPHDTVEQTPGAEPARRSWRTPAVIVTAAASAEGIDFNPGDGLTNLS